ncbi:MAG TPA: phytanoyl-CoA dioxygenase, partial [Dongiaceae bacterium]|nr:phytanoyl-CoA dioxygenase [Dongiaceae bacterium]
MGAAARPVRAVLFDKNADANWSAGWHQDRTIAVRARLETEGYGPWSVKGGAVHVEPPFDILRGMVTMRAHLDDCDEDNAPLLIAPG